MACGVLADYPIRYFSYWHNIQLPERSRKYFTSRGKHSPTEMGDFAKACRTMEAECRHKKAETIRTLADHMEHIISGSDTHLDIVAEGVYAGQQKTRDQATLDCQTWPLAFSIEGREFAKANGFRASRCQSCLNGSGRTTPCASRRILFLAGGSRSRGCARRGTLTRRWRTTSPPWNILRRSARLFTKAPRRPRPRSIAWSTCGGASGCVISGFR